MIIGRDELEMNGADEHCSDFALNDSSREQRGEQIQSSTAKT